jgi:4-amino-4-deoxy-L-arabinose transferase-like glycosyltransferase
MINLGLCCFIGIDYFYRVMKWLNPDNAKWILTISITVFVLIHLVYINLPPCSIHVWRQCNTLSVAQNFYDESYNILEPRVDRRFEGDGITGTAFPLYEWILAVIYKFTGVHYWVHRLLSLLLTITAIIFSFRFLNNITSNKLAAAIASCLLLWTPELFHHSINAIPDILALCAGFISLYFYSKKERNELSTTLSFLFLTVSGLIKIQYLMIGVFHLVDFIKSKIVIKKLILQDILIFICGLVCVTSVFSWYKYSLGLIEKSNLRDIGIEIRSAANMSIALDTLRKNLISDFPELVFGFANTLVIIIGCYATSIKKSNKYLFHFLGIFLIYVAYHILELRQMDVHHYYMIPIYFAVIALLYNGIEFLYRKGKFSFILILLIAQPALACIRIIPARWGKADLGISATFSDQSKLEKLKSFIPENARVVTGPDESGCIYFYFLHKKGFGYERPNQLTELKDGKLLLENYIDRGAEYLITSDAGDIKNKMLEKYFEEVIQYNEFYIIKLKK